jgi:hypothetical protein
MFILAPSNPKSNLLVSWTILFFFFVKLSFLDTWFHWDSVWVQDLLHSVKVPSHSWTSWNSFFLYSPPINIKEEWPMPPTAYTWLMHHSRFRIIIQTLDFSDMFYLSIKSVRHTGVWRCSSTHSRSRHWRIFTLPRHSPPIPTANKLGGPSAAEEVTAQRTTPVVHDMTHCCRNVNYNQYTELEEVRQSTKSQQNCELNEMLGAARNFNKHPKHKQSVRVIWELAHEKSGSVYQTLRTEATRPR